LLIFIRNRIAIGIGAFVATAARSPQSVEVTEPLRTDQVYALSAITSKRPRRGSAVTTFVAQT
jgi:hypothetical protein